MVGDDKKGRGLTDREKKYIREEHIYENNILPKLSYDKNRA